MKKLLCLFLCILLFSSSVSCCASYSGNCQFQGLDMGDKHPYAYVMDCFKDKGISFSEPYFIDGLGEFSCDSKNLVKVAGHYFGIHLLFFVGSSLDEDDGILMEAKYCYYCELDDHTAISKYSPAGTGAYVPLEDTVIYDLSQKLVKLYGNCDDSYSYDSDPYGYYYAMYIDAWNEKDKSTSIYLDTTFPNADDSKPFVPTAQVAIRYRNNEVQGFADKYNQRMYIASQTDGL